MASITLKPEQIENYKQILKKYTPYTEDEINHIETDSTEYDYWRRRAYMAQKALKEAGLLEE